MFKTFFRLLECEKKKFCLIYKENENLNLKFFKRREDGDKKKRMNFLFLKQNSREKCQNHRVLHCPQFGIFLHCLHLNKFLLIWEFKLSLFRNVISPNCREYFSKWIRNWKNDFNMWSCFFCQFVTDRQSESFSFIATPTTKKIS